MFNHEKNRNKDIMKAKVVSGLVFAAIVAMILPYSSIAFAGDLVIIANKDVPVSSRHVIFDVLSRLN